MMTQKKQQLWLNILQWSTITLDIWNAEYSCMYVRNKTTYELKSFSKLSRRFLEGTDRVVDFCDIMKDL